MALVNSSVVLHNRLVESELYRAAIGRNPNGALLKTALAEQGFELLPVRRIGAGGIDGILRRAIAVYRLLPLSHQGGCAIKRIEAGREAGEPQTGQVENSVVPAVLIGANTVIGVRP